MTYTGEHALGEGAHELGAAVTEGEAGAAASKTCAAHRHGTISARRRHGCVCPEARRDRKRYEHELAQGRPRTVDATGTRRRIQALMAIGHTGRQIMTELGWSGAALGAQFYQQDRVYRATAERVAAVYARLSDTPGTSSRTRLLAQRNGWLPPIWWDDDTIEDPRSGVDMLVDGPRKHHSSVDPVAVERFVSGDDAVPLTRAEKACAYKEMTRRRVPQNLILARLRISYTTARSFNSECVENDLNTAGTSGQNDSEAEQRANATRPLTETPAYPGGRPMPSISAHPPDSCQRVAG